MCLIIYQDEFDSVTPYNRHFSVKFSWLAKKVFGPTASLAHLDATRKEVGTSILTFADQKKKFSELRISFFYTIIGDLTSLRSTWW